MGIAARRQWEMIVISGDYLKIETAEWRLSRQDKIIIHVIRIGHTHLTITTRGESPSVPSVSRPIDSQAHHASRGFRHTGPSIWNSLPPHLRSIDTYTDFKSNLKTHLFCSASISGH